MRQSPTDYLSLGFGAESPGRLNQTRDDRTKYQRMKKKCAENVTVNFLCVHLSRSQYPEVWSNIILDYCFRIFLLVLFLWVNAD